jgi:MtN3 and saliva related transmembrane protein
MVTIIGIVAAICTTISFLPQVLKIRRTKQATDLSMPMYIVFSFGVLCWLIYGILIRSIPVILANAATLVLCLYILAMVIKYRLVIKK